MSKFFKKLKKHSLYDWANFYYEKGMSIIPLAPLKKTPAIESWKEYQERRPELKEIVEWFGGEENRNIAIMCGSVSGNLVVIDFDQDKLHDKFKERLLREDPDLYNKYTQTWVAKTKKGYHVYFRIDIPADEFKKKVRTEHPGSETIDVQAEGAYVVAPPSTVVSDDGKTKHKYYFLDGFSPDDTPEPEKLTWEEWEKIHAIVKELLKEIKAEEKQTEQQPIIEQTKQTEQPKKTPPIVSGGMRELSDNELVEIKSLLVEAWKPGNRHDLALFLSGWFAKSGIHPISIAKLLVMIVDETKAKGFPDTELEDRLSTIYYSYRKVFGREIEELKVLDQYIEELKKVGKVTKNVSRGEGISEEKVKGKSGVQEILENVLGEERALEIIRRLEEILGHASPYRDSVIVITDFEKGLGYVNDMRKLRIYKCRREENGNEKKIRAVRVIWEGAITRLTMYSNPLGGITKFEIVWESHARPGKPMTISGNLEEIYDRLKIEGFMAENRYGRDALSNIINGFIMKGKAEIRTDIDSPGFYIVDNKLINIKYGITTPTKEELKEALMLLDELANKWYNHVKEKFAVTIEWGVIAPFVYAKKQLGRQYQVPHIVLYGARNTGKTTLAEIASIYLWEVEGVERRFSVGEAETEARLGRILSLSTFPIVINEANKMFMGDPGVINMLKNSVEEKVVRGKFTKYGYVENLALAPMAITLNPQPPIDFEGLMLVPKTLLLIYFSEGERLSPERIAEFRKDIEPQLPKLKVIGQYIAKLMLEKGAEELKKDWRELAIELLSQAYVDAGLTPPDWLNLTYEQPSFEDIDRERREVVKSMIKKYSIELFTRNVMKIIDVRENGSEYPVEESVNEIVDTLLRRGLYPFIKQEGDKLYITRVILNEIKLEVANLKDLAELLGWKYLQKKHFKDGSVLSVIEVTKEEFIQFLES